MALSFFNFRHAVGNGDFDVPSLCSGIRDIQEQIDSRLRESPNTTRVLLLGTTCSGKSTLIHAFADKIIKAKRSCGRMRLEVDRKDMLEGFVIGDTAISATSFPGFYYSENKDLLFLDCPGFGETRGEG